MLISYVRDLSLSIKILRQDWPCLHSALCDVTTHIQRFQDIKRDVPQMFLKVHHPSVRVSVRNDHKHPLWLKHLIRTRQHFHHRLVRIRPAQQRVHEPLLKNPVVRIPLPRYVDCVCYFVRQLFQAAV